MKQNRASIFLAALLHDIGKFSQRADLQGSARSQMLSQSVKKLESTFCPYNQQKQYFSHKHVLYTAQFIEDLAPHLQNLSVLERERYHSQTDSLLQLAAGHHKPNQESVMQKIVQKADHYASGIDRTGAMGQADAAAEHKWDDFKRARMRSIFEAALVENPTYSHYLPIDKLAFAKSYFPAKEVPHGQEAYAQMWREFTQEVKHLQAHSTKAFTEGLYALLHKYTTYIPSSTQHLPDVSLFDHLKITAAFALSLYDVYQAQKALPKATDKPFLLIGGDLSGIQRYLYDIVSANASKNLKGRSYYLQLLVDSVVERVLNDLELYQANLVYASGGGFYIIAANTKKNAQLLEALEHEIQTKLYEAHGTQLALAFAWLPFGEQELFGKDIGEQVWRKLGELLNKKKRTQWADLMQHQYSQFFEPIGKGAETQRDALSGDELAENEEVAMLDGQKVHLLTKKQVELGKTLKDVDYHILSKSPINYWGQEVVSLDVINLGVYHYFLSDKKLEQYREKLKASADAVKVLAVNDANFLESALTGSENIYGFELYGGNKYPEKSSNGQIRPKYFDELAGEEDGKLKRLGVLRMDVDNLGQVFTRGLDKDKRSFSRYATLSRSLDYFFKGYLNAMWQQNVRYKAHTYIIYSGGDDLFIIGKWDVLLEMAIEIKEHFTSYTCHNPHLSLSGGMTLVTGKYPIMKGASLAEEAEKMAKSHIVERLNAAGQLQHFEKDSLTILDKPLNFSHELPVVLALKNTIMEHINQKWLPMGFLSRVARYASYQLADQNKALNRNQYQWRWLMAYDMGRMANSNKQAADFLSQIQIDAFANAYQGEKLHSQYHFIELLNIACRLVSLELRT